MQHTGQLHIDPIANLAGHYVGDIDPWQGLACECPRCGILQRDVLGRGQFRGIARELSIAEFSPTGAVHHHAHAGFAFGGRHA